MNTTSAIIPVSTRSVSTDTTDAAFDDIAALALLSVSSDQTKRVYKQTFDAWRAWAEANGVSSFALTPQNVVAFLASAPTTKATRQRQLSTLRKLAEKMYTWVLVSQPGLSPMFDAMRRELKDLKAPKPVSSDGERKGRALCPAEADKLLRAWNGPTPQHKRNAALVALLLLTGIRRSEAAALLWSDIDFENGTITIKHGKGDKRRVVPIAGDYALDALREWQMCQPSYQYVFSPVERGGGVGKDRPITGTDVYRILQATQQAASVEAFSPHDARRTFITEALATGTPLATVQAAAGHARGETTLRYAQAVNAREARKQLRLRYG